MHNVPIDIQRVPRGSGEGGLTKKTPPDFILISTHHNDKEKKKFTGELSCRHSWLARVPIGVDTQHPEPAS